MTKTMMKAIQLFGKEQLQLVEVAKPEINEHELLVKVKAASICGTDVRMYKNGYQNVSPENPLTLGHEIAGVIEVVGNKVKGYQTGQRVALAPNMGCGICDQCVSGNTHLCDTYQAFGINLPGGFSEYIKVPEEAIRQGNVTMLEDGISYEEAALIEPFSCVFNGQEIAEVHAGDIVLIIGSGPIGIMHAMLAFSKGASKVIMNDLQESRLLAAKELMPQLIVMNSSNLQEQIQKETNGHGIDLCIIAAPAPQAQSESLHYMAMNGRLLFFGGLPKERENVPLNTNILHYLQLRIFGCTRASLSGYRTSEKLIASGRIAVDKLITKRYTIEEFEQAFDNAKQAVGLKNVFVFD